MRVPVLWLHRPELELWFTDEALIEHQTGLTLKDTQNRTYRPADIRGPLLVREYLCPRHLYDAARQAGYPVVWID